MSDFFLLFVVLDLSINLSCVFIYEQNLILQLSNKKRISILCTHNQIQELKNYFDLNR